jgi:hypothetical protein
MELEERAELRTLARSMVQFKIPPDQTFVVDRATTIRVLRASFEGGKLKTDIGMPYGRVGWEIEAEGREHDGTIRSPNSILAVRGTKVALYDQPPFTPQAISLTGTAMFRDAKKRIAFGGKGKTRVRTDASSAAEVALSAAVVDPSISRARTPSEEELVTYLTSRGAVTFFDPIRGIDVVQGGPGPGLETTQFLQRLPGVNIVTSWTGDANVDMSVNVQNKGEFLYPIAGLDRYPSGSRFLFDHRGGQMGGFEVASFPSLGPLEGQTYFVGAQNLSGAPANVTFSAFEDGRPLLIDPQDPSKGQRSTMQNVGIIFPGGSPQAIKIGAGLDEARPLSIGANREPLSNSTKNSSQLSRTRKPFR